MLSRADPEVSYLFGRAGVDPDLGYTDTLILKTSKNRPPGARLRLWLHHPVIEAQAYVEDEGLAFGVAGARTEIKKARILIITFRSASSGFGVGQTLVVKLVSEGRQRHVKVTA